MAKKVRGITLTSKGWTGSSSGTWSTKSNIARDTKWPVTNDWRKGKNINTLAGNDIISGKENLIDDSPGIDLSETTLNMGEGNDIAEGTGRWSAGLSLYVSQLITEGGNDRVVGQGAGGIFLDESFINTGAGDDEIIGGALDEYSETGIYLSSYRDSISGIDTGEGNDKITGYAYEGKGIMIWEKCTISMGAGDDMLTVYTTNSDTRYRDSGISNYGAVSMGDGNDVISALGNWAYGFYSSTLNGENSYFDMGNGDDTVKGFGYGQIRGGDGVDKLLLPEGTYTVTGSSNAASVTKIMTVDLLNFEQVGSAVSGSVIALSSIPLGGMLTLSIDSAGNITTA